MNRRVEQRNFPIDFSRRTFLAGSAALSAAWALRSGAGIAATPGEDGFIELTASKFSRSLYEPGTAESEVWGFNGEVPGPVLRARKGEELRIRFRNELDAPSSVHWHGIRLPNAMDGVPGLTQEPVEPGGEFEYVFTPPDAGTFWYHSHHRSWDQVERGLYGALIVEEPDPVLPAERDILLVLDDWRLKESGAFDEESMGALMDWAHAGRLGNWLLVNGRSQPEINLAAGGPNRVRLLNASNARILSFDLARMGAQVIALDGQPAEMGTTRLELAPAQRADILVTAETGKDILLEEVSGDPVTIVSFKGVAGDPATSTDIELPAPSIPEPDLASVRRVRMVLQGGAMGRIEGFTHMGRKLEGDDFRKTGQVWAINSVANMPESPAFSLNAGEAVEIEFVNETAWPHGMHTHGHHFRVLDAAGKPISDVWRDTVLLAPRETVKIVFVADNPGKWMLHCHMLEHAAGGMNSWFEVKA